MCRRDLTPNHFSSTNKVARRCAVRDVCRLESLRRSKLCSGISLCLLFRLATNAHTSPAIGTDGATSAQSASVVCQPAHCTRRSKRVCVYSSTHQRQSLGQAMHPEAAQLISKLLQVLSSQHCRCCRRFVDVVSSTAQRDPTMRPTFAAMKAEPFFHGTWCCKRCLFFFLIAFFVRAQI